ncbi:MAG TPA: FtsW/RodA/SpoVE family cell cycle protein, partial [Patescibacteria group bacterium]
MSRHQGHQPDYILIITFGSILLIGLIMLSSVSTAVAFDKFGDSYYYFKHQLLFGVIPGLIILYILSRLNYHRWRKFAFPLLIITIGLLIAVFLPGIGFQLKGAHRWISLGGILFQPSEIAKLTFLIYLASWLESKGERKLKDVDGGFLPFIFTLGTVMLLIILQPDIGTT